MKFEIKSRWSGAVLFSISAIPLIASNGSTLGQEPSAEMPTAPNPFEEEESDGPDPYDAQIETEMEREARNHAGNE